MSSIGSDMSLLTLDTTEEAYADPPKWRFDYFGYKLHMLGRPGAQVLAPGRTTSMVELRERVCVKGMDSAALQSHMDGTLATRRSPSSTSSLDSYVEPGKNRMSSVSTVSITVRYDAWC